VLWEKFSNVDVAFVQRPAEPAMADVISRLKGFGIKVWSDFDDDFFHIQSDNKVFTSVMSPAFQKSVRACLQMSDVVTVSTQALAGVIQKETGKKATVIRNAIDPRWWTHRGPQVPREDSVTWRGLDSHHRDMESVRDPILNWMLRHKEYHLNIFGYNPYFITDFLPNRFRYFKAPIFQFYDALFKSGGKAGIVPLLPNIFNECKSNIAFIELAMTGHAVVAPTMQEFTDIPCVLYNEHGDHKTFTEALDYAIGNHKALAKLGYDKVMSDFTLDKWNTKRLEILESL
jgi:hypothetical protein